jgi:cytoskeleton protein RodZ
VGEFGDKFRKARESKDLSLDDVSNVTKISARMLQAIEQEDFDQLPGGVFNRGFIRAYAKHLGLNSEDAVNDYLACLRQAQIDSHNGWDAEQRPDPHAPVTTAPSAPSVLRTFKPVAKVEPTPPGPVQVEELPELQLPRIEHVRPPKKEYLSNPSSGIPWIRVAAALCLLIAVFFFWSRYTRGTRAARATPIAAATTTAPVLQPPATSTEAVPAQTAQPAPTSTPPAQSVVAAQPAIPAPAQTSPVQVATPAPTSSAQHAQPAAPTPQPVTRQANPVPQKATTDEDPNAVKVEKKGDVTVRSFGAATAKPVEKTATTLKLVVRATENSWISVTADGQLLTQETLIAPAATSFHATRELVVRVGNAAGVAFLWNGQEIPPQGSESEAKTFVFDAEGMHAATSQPQN